MYTFLIKLPQLISRSVKDISYTDILTRITPKDFVDDEFSYNANRETVMAKPQECGVEIM